MKISTAKIEKMLRANQALEKKIEMERLYLQARVSKVIVEGIYRSAPDEYGRRTFVRVLPLARVDIWLDSIGEIQRVFRVLVVPCTKTGTPRGASRSVKQEEFKVKYPELVESYT